MKKTLLVPVILLLLGVVSTAQASTLCPKGVYTTTNLCCTLDDGAGDPSEWIVIISTGARALVRVDYDGDTGIATGDVSRIPDGKPVKMSSVTCAQAGNNFVLTANWNGQGLQGNIEANLIGLDNYLPWMKIISGQINNHQITSTLISGGYE